MESLSVVFFRIEQNCTCLCHRTPEVLAFLTQLLLTFCFHLSILDPVEQLGRLFCYLWIRKPDENSNLHERRFRDDRMHRIVIGNKRVRRTGMDQQLVMIYC